MTVNIACFEDLDAVGADAAGSLGRDAQTFLYNRLDWFRLIQTHVPPAGRLAVWRARNGKKAAWLFLAVEGKKASAYAAWYSLRFNGIGDSDVMTSLAEAIRRSGVAEVELAPLEDPEPLAAAFRAAGWRVRLTEKTGNWRVITEGENFDVLLGEASRAIAQHREAQGEGCGAGDRDFRPVRRWCLGRL